MRGSNAGADAFQPWIQLEGTPHPRTPMSSKIRIASGLLLVYPAVSVFGSVRAAVVNEWPGYLMDGLLLAIYVVVVSLYLWRGRRWAYTSALICSAGLAITMVLYELVIASLWGREAWEEWSPSDYAFHYLPFVVLIAVSALLVRHEAFAGARRRALTLVGVALAAELVLIALITRYGIGSLFAGQALHQVALDVSQLPGSALLVQMGMCCGYENHTIISDALDPHWGGITMQGLPVLIVANTLGLVPLVVMARSLRKRLRHPGASVVDPAAPLSR